MEKEANYLLIHWKSNLLPALFKDNLPCASPVVCAVGVGLPSVHFMDVLVRDQIGLVGAKELKHELDAAEIISLSELIREKEDLIICVVREPDFKMPVIYDFPVIDPVFLIEGPKFKDKFDDLVLTGSKKVKTKYQKPNKPLKSVFNSQNKQRLSCFYRKK